MRVLGSSKTFTSQAWEGATACPGKPGSSNWALPSAWSLTLGAAGMYRGLPFTPVLHRKDFSFPIRGQMLWGSEFAFILLIEELE